jgi:hypothetical protein
MRSSSSFSFAIACVVREVCWIAALAAFVLQAFMKRTYPLVDAVGIFLVSATIMRALRASGLRVVHQLLIHATALVCILLRSAHTAWHPLKPFWTIDGWRALATPRAAHDWLIFAVVAFWSLVFWRAGMQHAERPHTYREACSRFDRGLTWLFALLLVRLLLRGQLGPAWLEQVSGLLLYPYVASGLLALAIARNADDSPKRFARGYRMLGLATSVGVLLLALGLGYGLLNMPGLKAATATSYGGMKAVTRPVANTAIEAIEYLLRLLNFSPNIVTERTRDPSLTGSGFNVPASRALSDGARETQTSLLGLRILAAVALAVTLVYLRRWLLSRRPKVTTGDNAWRRLRRWLGRAPLAIGAWFQPESSREPIRLYVALLKWGRRSGLRHRPHETPREYAERLKAQRLDVNAPIDLIVSVFHSHVYGQSEVDELQMTRARRALRRIRSPLLWPARVRLLLASTGEEEPPSGLSPPQ